MNRITVKEAAEGLERSFYISGKHTDNLIQECRDLSIKVIEFYEQGLTNEKTESQIRFNNLGCKTHFNSWITNEIRQAYDDRWPYPMDLD